jgi:hypothetical protein
MRESSHVSLSAFGATWWDNRHVHYSRCRGLITSAKPVDIHISPELPQIFTVSGFALTERTHCLPDSDHLTNPRLPTLLDRLEIFTYLTCHTLDSTHSWIFSTLNIISSPWRMLRKPSRWSLGPLIQWQDDI